jgi:hypothetical protein
MTGQRITMAELNARHLARVRQEQADREAYRATPQGAAEEAERQRLFRLEVEEAAGRRHDHHADGKAANLAGEPREAPEDLDEADAEQWLAGWDSEGEDTEA